METIEYSMFATDLGAMALAWRGGAIVGTQLPDVDRETTLRALCRKLAGAVEAPPNPTMAAVIERIRACLRGRTDSFRDVAVEFGSLPPFTRAVLEVLRRVEPGRTITYAQLAELSGSPGASRAVGQAMARNPVPLIVPCHRVLARRGPGGFSGGIGLPTKRRLLALEGVLLA